MICFIIGLEENCFQSLKKTFPRGVIVEAMDCEVVVIKFVLQSCYDVHFRANSLGKGINSHILPAMG